MSSRLWLYCHGKIPTFSWNFFENALLGITQEALAAVEFLDQKCEENRALQVIRYADEKELSEECHYAAVFAEFEKLIF